MKQGNIVNWENSEKCLNLLFFAELINELLFDYSIPSNRISTLNSHFLCLDAISAIDGIDNHGVPQGTLKPIMEELYSELCKDPAFCKDNHPLNYFIKYHDSKIVIVKKISDMNYLELKQTALALNNIFFRDNLYYESLKKKIIEIVQLSDTDRQKDLFRLTKSILTELNNSGYDVHFIYRVMNKVFWGNNKVSSPNSINAFFAAFDFKNHNYNVIYKVRLNELKKITNLIGFEKFETKPNVKCEDKAYFKFIEKESDERFLTFPCKALDPFSAEHSIRKTIDNIISVYRLYDHSINYRISSINSGICDENNFFILSSEIKAVEHTKTPPKKQIIESLGVSIKAISDIADKSFPDFISLVNAIRFHSHSIDSFSRENQLLDFWAIFETVLDISNEHTSDRINQVCRFLIPVLKRRYIYSLFEQLLNDIKEYDLCLLKRIVGDANNNIKKVHRLCEFVLLQEKTSEREQVLNDIKLYPLLKERILYYNEQLCTPKKIHAFVDKHAERVRWQVMRIYRNRNLIIHNGKSMPYLGLLIENLHSYVDEFLSYYIHQISKVHNFNSVNQELFIRECKWNEKFSNNKDPISRELIEECLQFHS